MPFEYLSERCVSVQFCKLNFHYELSLRISASSVYRRSSPSTHTHTQDRMTYANFVYKMRKWCTAIESAATSIGCRRAQCHKINDRNKRVSVSWALVGKMCSRCSLSLSIYLPIANSCSGIYNMCVYMFCVWQVFLESILLFLRILDGYIRTRRPKVKLLNLDWNWFRQYHTQVYIH